MIESIANFDSVVAAGILARAALALEDESNPAASPAVRDEVFVRQQVFAGIRKKLGLDPGDKSRDAVERITNLLDIESDSLIGTTNPDAALNSLSSKGQLPSDLYDVSIIENIKQFCGRNFEREAALIRRTVRSPDLEEHLGPGDHSTQALPPFLISLFTKVFADKYALKSFVMVVAGERNGLRFTVHQAWRLYQDDVNLIGAQKPIEMLKRFANAFGVNVALGGKEGHFIEIADIAPGERVPNVIEIKHKGKPTVFTLTYSVQMNPAQGSRRAAMVVAIDLNRYRESLTRHDSKWR